MSTMQFSIIKSQTEAKILYWLKNHPVNQAKGEDRKFKQHNTTDTGYSEKIYILLFPKGVGSFPHLATDIRLSENHYFSWVRYYQIMFLISRQCLSLLLVISYYGDMCANRNLYYVRIHRDLNPGSSLVEQ